MRLRRVKLPIIRDWSVYIVKTAKGNLYTGVSKDVERRVYDHNNTKRGAKCPSDSGCDHEIDWDGNFDNFNGDEIAKWKAVGFYCQCRHCGGAGVCMDDTGNFWLDEDGYYV